MATCEVLLERGHAPWLPTVRLPRRSAERPGPAAPATAALRSLSVLRAWPHGDTVTTSIPVNATCTCVLPVHTRHVKPRGKTKADCIFTLPRQSGVQVILLQN